MYMRDRLPEAEMMAIGLPAATEEEERGPPSGRPICRCLTRRVGVQLGCLIITLHPPPQTLRGLPLTLWRALPTFRRAGWKDLSHILRGFYLYNYPNKMEADWEKLRVKFLNHLGQCQDKWKTIKEEVPLEYMPYMEHHFLLLTGIRL